MRSSRGRGLMNSLAWLAAALLCMPPALPAAGSPQYHTALPGYAYSFPRDHFNHPDFQTEWWYYTGNLKAADGHRFGFELTFFRRGVNRDAPATASTSATKGALAGVSPAEAKAGPWDVRDVYLAHLTLSDLDGGQFYHTTRTNRAGPGIAGVDESSGRIWNGNWQIAWKNGDQELQAIAGQFALHFAMHSQKPPVIHGENGVSQKAEGAGHASHYISFTRLFTTGAIEWSGRKFEVSGSSWMDHEFFTDQLTADQAGWDWLSIQLDGNTELMVFRIRRKDGSIDRYSSGTFVDAAGTPKHLRAADFALQPSGETWTSPATHATYPIRWRIVVPSLGIDLAAQTPLPSQEFTSEGPLATNYWEGAIDLSGTESARGVKGVGYLEMTGYDKAINR